jgi:hypothetical protein
MEHLFRDHLSKHDNEVLDLRERGTPGRPVRSPDTIDEVFCHTFEIGANRIDMRGRVFDEGHPCLPVGLRPRVPGEFSAPV